MNKRVWVNLYDRIHLHAAIKCSRTKKSIRHIPETLFLHREDDNNKQFTLHHSSFIRKLIVSIFKVIDAWVKMNDV